MFLLHGTTPLYNYTVREKLENFKKKLSKNLTASKNYTDRWRVSIFAILGRTLLELSKMGSMKSVAFLVQKIVCNLFSMR